MRRAASAALLLTLVLLGAPTRASAQSGTQLPPIKHVFVIVLENKSYDETFGADPGSPYLGVDLRAQGNLLEQYYATGHASLDNYITMVSGLPPNPLTQADCPLPPWSACVNPALISTVANQIDAAGLTWRGYMEDMPAPCDHPGLGLTDRDLTETATAASQYATRHNPFMYFSSIIGDPARCAADVVNLDQLPHDLASASTTPNYVFITPDLCSDGHDVTCADGGPGGYAGIDAFLRTWVPQIEHSPAWANSLLLITFDEAETADSSACCFSTPFAGISGNGGGRIGALAISPFIAPGTSSTVPYNHCSMLASVEDLYGLPRLGGAADAASVPFGADVYNATALPRAMEGAEADSGALGALDAAGGTGGTDAPAAPAATLPATGNDETPALALTALLVVAAFAARRFRRAT